MKNSIQLSIFSIEVLYFCSTTARVFRLRLDLLLRGQPCLVLLFRFVLGHFLHYYVPPRTGKGKENFHIWHISVKLRHRSDRQRPKQAEAGTKAKAKQTECDARKLPKMCVGSSTVRVRSECVCECVCAK